MVSAKLVRATTFGAAAALALTFAAPLTFAQDKKAAPAAKPAAQPAQPAQQAGAQGAQKNPDIWYKLCIDVPVIEPGKPGEQPKQSDKKTNVCLTQVDVRDNATAILIGKLAVRQVQGQDKPQLLAMLPPGIALPPGALVKVDDKEPIKLTYTTCDQAGCYAEANVEAATVAAMKTGKQVAYLGIDVTGRPISIPLPLEGFAKALDGQPVPVDKYNEDQRKIAEVIRTRLADLRKQQEAAQGQQQPAAGAQQPAAKPVAPAQQQKK